MLTSAQAAAEVRLFDLGPYFQSAHQSLRRGLRLQRLSQLKTQSRASLAAAAVALLISGVAAAWMVRQALLGFATLGDLVLFYQAFTRGQGLSRLLLGSLGQIYSNTLFLGNLFAFLDLKPVVRSPSLPAKSPIRIKRGIEFRDISFRYAGSERDALHGFNLFVPANKIIAIVGPNGAGKTTLLKLLCRFYDPDNGQIRIDETDIRELALKDVRRLTTVLFQIPMVYHETARH